MDKTLLSGIRITLSTEYINTEILSYQSENNITVKKNFELDKKIFTRLDAINLVHEFFDELEKYNIIEKV